MKTVRNDRKSLGFGMALVWPDGYDTNESGQNSRAFNILVEEV